jgi:hypothetical protein
MGSEASGRERERRGPAPAPVAARPAPSAPRSGPVARALALQRLAGNRAAARVLARWTAHPDAEKKGVMVPDAAAEDYTRFNPPQNT